MALALSRSYLHTSPYPCSSARSLMTPEAWDSLGFAWQINKKYSSTTTNQVFSCIPSPRAKGYMYLYYCGGRGGPQGRGDHKGRSSEFHCARHTPTRPATVTVSVSLNLFHDSGHIGRCSHVLEWSFSGTVGRQ